MVEFLPEIIGDFVLLFWSSVELKVELLLVCWFLLGEEVLMHFLIFWFAGIFIFLQFIWLVGGALENWFIVDFLPNHYVTNVLMRFSLLCIFGSFLDIHVVSGSHFGTTRIYYRLVRGWNIDSYTGR